MYRYINIRIDKRLQDMIEEYVKYNEYNTLETYLTQNVCTILEYVLLCLSFSPAIRNSKNENIHVKKVLSFTFQRIFV